MHCNPQHTTGGSSIAYTLSLAAQCISVLYVCLQRAGGRCLCVGLETTITVGEVVSSDHLQLILAVLRPREGGLRRGENFWLRVTTASAQCLRLSERFFHYLQF